MNWTPAPDITKRITFLVSELHLSFITSSNIISFRSYGSTGRATARIWGLPTIWQQALSVGPHYCLEVISERFDKLSLDDQEKVLIHELMHVPKSFSGALVPHRNHKHRSFKHYHDTMDTLFKSLKRKSYE